MPKKGTLLKTCLIYKVHIIYDVQALNTIKISTESFALLLQSSDFLCRNIMKFKNIVDNYKPVCNIAHEEAAIRKDRDCSVSSSTLNKWPSSNLTNIYTYITLL